MSTTKYQQALYEAQIFCGTVEESKTMSNFKDHPDYINPAEWAPLMALLSIMPRDETPDPDDIPPII